MKQFEPSLQWALKFISYYQNGSILDNRVVAQTAYSVVHKIKTTEQIFYLKQTPPALFSETKMLAFLNQKGCKNIPKIITQNDELHCFLMVACGDESLRYFFNGQVDFNWLKTGILNYTKIQRLLENKVQQLLALGIPDWRLNKFPTLYDQLIQQDSLLIKDGLTKKEIGQLRKLSYICTELCETLLQYHIPDTINHCDFHENNMLLDKKTGVINIVDWGETVITHPFFSLNGCLWNITYFNSLNNTDSMYQKLQVQSVSAWLDLYDEKTLLNILNIANRLNGVYAALVYEQIYIATKDEPKTVQQTHPGSIAGCLRSFLSE